MSKLLLVCTKCQRKFEDRRSLTQHQCKSTTCRSQTALSINVNLVNNEGLLPPDLLVFLSVNLTKHRQALAKNPPAKANLARQQPQSNKTGAAKTTGLKSSLETSIKDDDDSDDDFAGSSCVWRWGYQSPWRTGCCGPTGRCIGSVWHWLDPQWLDQIRETCTKFSAFYPTAAWSYLASCHFAEQQGLFGDLWQGNALAFQG